MKMYNRSAFTLVEVLITLGIIGVVSAIILPTVINKINDLQYSRAREKALSTIGEAGKILAVQGYINDAQNSEDFVKNYLSKHLKIAKYCSLPTECGFTDNISTMGKERIISIPNTIRGLNEGLNLTLSYKTTSKTSYAFVTANGYSVNLYYNPQCKSLNNNGFDYTASVQVCMNAIYDMNGLKAPNEVGKDIGWVTVLGNNELAVATAPLFEISGKDITSGEKFNWSNANNVCSGKGLTLPTWYELESAAYNKSLTNFTTESYWSGTAIDVGYAFLIRISDGARGWNVSSLLKSSQRFVRCVKR